VHAVDGLDHAPLVPAPEKILCIGQNYADHIAEMGNKPPAYPTVFAKFAPALVGAYDDIVLPAVSDAVDYEAELAVVIGRPVRHATPEQAQAAIAGYTVLNDVSARDWQFRTSQYLQGKTFERTTPLGPLLVTPDELPAGGWEISTVIDGETRQHSTTAELVFGPVDLVGYLSTILTLHPGDVIATGTPGGVGHARKPPRYLTDGATMVTAIAGVGACRNVCRAEKPVAGGTP
jgi:acylpyruvate hydrolase